MKIFLLHGDDVVKSSERLDKFIAVAKNRGWKVDYLEENNFSISEQASSTSLFDKNRFMVVKSIKSIKERDLVWLKKHSQETSGHLVIWSDKKIPKTYISKFPKDARIEEFKLPVLIWKFLDGFFPGNAKEEIRLLNEIVETEPVELVFFLLSNHLRDLYWVKEDVGSVPYPSWRVGKLKSQSGKYTNGSLEKIISDLAAADVKSKTSDSNLKDLLDFIIIEKLL